MSDFHFCELNKCISSRSPFDSKNHGLFEVDPRPIQSGRFLRRHSVNLSRAARFPRARTMSSLAFSAGAVMGTRVVAKTQPTSSTRRVSLAVTAKQVLEGKVVSTAMDKSAVVMVSRKIPHPRYHKLMKKTQKFTFHDEANACVVGETVRVEACRPMSKSKKFTLLEKVQK